MKDEDKIFILFSCCVPVLGAARSIIYDLQRMEYHFIPNVLYSIVTENEYLHLRKIKERFDNKDSVVIDQYFAYLLEKELGFWGSQQDAESFPRIALQWESPLNITNAILDIGENFKFITKDFVYQLSDLGCAAVHIRIYERIALPSVRNVLEYFKGSRIRSLYLLTPYSRGITPEAHWQLMVQFPRVKNIYVHGSPYDKKSRRSGRSLVYSQDEFKSEAQCGVTREGAFCTSLDVVTESIRHNSCLNRKISVDKFGNIKNCPSLPDSFGNIRDTTLAEALEKPGFKDYWHINKDKIQVCMDCEFRYICTDCRAYVEDPKDIYSKPLKCGYDPYSGKWSEWSTNPLKQKAIEYYSI